MLIHSFTTKTDVGLGDFLRGSYFLYFKCKQADTEYYIDFSRHPMYEFIIPPLETPPEYSDTKIYFNINQKIEKEMYESCILKAKTENISICCNTIPLQKNREALNFVKNHMLFTDEIKDMYDKLSIPDDYTVLHIRYEDGERKAKEKTKKILEFVDDKKIDNKNIVLISNHEDEKKGLSEKFIVLEKEACHVGRNHDREKIKRTLLEYYILTKAKKIIQISSYSWGSGFSDSAASLYDIPIDRYVFSSHLNIIKPTDNWDLWKTQQ